MIRYLAVGRFEIIVLLELDRSLVSREVVGESVERALAAATALVATLGSLIVSAASSA